MKDDQPARGADAVSQRLPEPCSGLGSQLDDVDLPRAGSSLRDSEQNPREGSTLGSETRRSKKGLASLQALDLLVAETRNLTCMASWIPLV